MSELEKIYYQYQNDLERGGDNESAIRARESLYGYFDKSGLLAHDYEDYVCSLACENEKQGFLSGFQYAMKIALECMSN